jgi:hypothetical protein
MKSQPHNRLLFRVPSRLRAVETVAAGTLHAFPQNTAGEGDAAFARMPACRTRSYSTRLFQRKVTGGAGCTAHPALDFAVSVKTAEEPAAWLASPL